MRTFQWWVSFSINVWKDPCWCIQSAAFLSTRSPAALRHTPVMMLSLTLNQENTFTPAAVCTAGTLTPLLPNTPTLPSACGTANHSLHDMSEWFWCFHAQLVCVYTRMTRYFYTHTLFIRDSLWAVSIIIQIKWLVSVHAHISVICHLLRLPHPFL